MHRLPHVASTEAGSLLCLLFVRHSCLSPDADPAPVLRGVPDLMALSCAYMQILKTTCLFALTAVAEIVGCYLPYLGLRREGSPWPLLPALPSLGLFAWLLTLHPTGAGRVYAAYGGVYICVAIAWLWLIDGVRPTLWDVCGMAVCLAGMVIIVLGSSHG